MKNVLLTVGCFLILTSYACADSLWRDNAFPAGSLFADNKARCIGDIVTIKISEATSANRSSETNTSKDVTNTGSVTDWLYPHENTPGLLAHKDDLPTWEYSMDKEFNGKGEIKESDSFTAKITAVVIDVLPNGNMLIKGDREVVVAGEKKKITIAGTIRESDIEEDNTIESNLIADAKIYYEGKGPISDNQRRGFFTWIRDMFSMF